MAAKDSAYSEKKSYQTPAPKPTEPAKLTPGVQYVGSKLQYVDPAGNILPVSAAPETYNPEKVGMTSPGITPQEVARLAEEKRLAKIQKDKDDADKEAARIAALAGNKGITGGPVGGGNIPGGVIGGGIVGGTTTGYADKLAADLLAQQKADAAAAAAAAQLQKQEARANSIAVMRARFKQYGLETLATKIEQLTIDGASEATITLQLQETPEYQTRFKANAERIKKNLQVLTPAEYLATEDTYRQILRSYGLKQFDTDEYVSQFLSNDVSPTELSNRVQIAVQRVQNADPAVSKTLRDYYGIGSADLVAYTLDPATQFQKIERQVQAAEIGTAARIQGLETGMGVAEQLAAQGVTAAEAQKGYATIADILPTAEKLSAIYGTTMEGYTQSSGEQEVFNSLASAQRARQRLSAREVAQFSGAAGTTKGSLASQKSGQI